jgi:drug/metabolite transporter (DMT)-like permease
MPRATWVGLVLCNIMWAANPIMGKFLLSRFAPHEVAWLRYFSATSFFWSLGLLSFLFTGRKLGWIPRPSKFFSIPKTRRDFFLILGMGVSAFCFAPLVAFFGLNKTAAVDNAILIALEPLVTVGLAAVFLGERFDQRRWLSLLVSIVGFAFLSGLAFQSPSQWWSQPAIIGNLILVVSLLGEGGYSIFARLLQGKHSTLGAFGSGLTLGFLILNLVVMGLSGLPDLTRLGVDGFFALFWLGPMGSTLTYLYWAFALEKTDVSSAALTLYVQPVVGALLGVFLLSDAFTPSKALGAALIFCAVGVLTLGEKKNSI